jgi:hypothetical protein
MKQLTNAKIKHINCRYEKVYCYTEYLNIASNK